MPIGKNIGLKDKLIKKTTNKANITSKESKRNKTSPGIKRIPSGEDTHNTVKMTFYVKTDLLEKLYNFAYWDRLSVTKAVNTLLQDGLKGKNTKARQ